MDPLEIRVQDQFSSWQDAFFSTINFYTLSQPVKAYLFADWPTLNTSEVIHSSFVESEFVGPDLYEYHSFYLMEGSSVQASWVFPLPINTFIVADWQWDDWVAGDLSQCLHTFYGSNGSYLLSASGIFYFAFDNSGSGLSNNGNFYYNVTRMGIDTSNALDMCDMQYSACQLRLPFASSSYLVLISRGSSDVGDSYSVPYDESRRWLFVLLFVMFIPLGVCVVPPLLCLFFCVCWRRSSYSTLN